MADPFLLKYAEKGYNMAVSNEHEGLDEYKAVEQLAVVLDLLVEDIWEDKAFSLLTFIQAHSCGQLGLD